MAFDKQHVHIRRILEWFGKYRAGSLDIEGLQANIAAIHGALEGDVPVGTRNGIETAHEMLEYIRFGSRSSDDVEKIIQAVECQIDHDIRSSDLQDASYCEPDWSQLWETVLPPQSRQHIQ